MPHGPWTVLEDPRRAMPARHVKGWREGVRQAALRSAEPCRERGKAGGHGGERRGQSDRLIQTCATGEGPGSGNQSDPAQGKPRSCRNGAGHAVAFILFPAAGFSSFEVSLQSCGWRWSPRPWCFATEAIPAEPSSNLWEGRGAQNRRRPLNVEGHAWQRPTPRGETASHPVPSARPPERTSCPHTPAPTGSREHARWTARGWGGPAAPGGLWAEGRGGPRLGVVGLWPVGCWDSNLTHPMLAPGGDPPSRLGSPEFLDLITPRSRGHVTEVGLPSLSSPGGQGTGLKVPALQSPAGPAPPPLSLSMGSGMVWWKGAPL